MKIKDSPKTYKKELGQVFTSPDVAKLMVNLIKPFLYTGAECLDPCIGENIFFKELSKYKYRFLTGIELDDSLIGPSTRDFYKVNNRQLIIDSFFNFGLDKKFDVIIMNPPYLRQELLKDKNEITRVLREKYSEIPGKSNLYVYFFLKALKHLKDKGILVAIIYDSWLFTDFGRIFKKLILNNHSLKKIIHFKNGAFDNVNVGATIILMNQQGRNEKIEYYFLDSPIDLLSNGSLPENKKRTISEEDIFDFHKLWGNVIDFSQGIFYPISMISAKPITRGTEAIVNKFFIFDTDRFPPYTKKIVKRVTDIKMFEVKNKFKYLLKLPENITTKTIKDYIDSISNRVQSRPELYKSLRVLIQNNPHWYVIKGEANGNVIFNYYMRDNIHFIYNPKRFIVSGNFYNLYINKNIYANLCILNSSITKLALFKYGKSQGHGLFKIQLNKFKNIPIINLNKLKKSTIKKLEVIGQDLCKTKRANFSSLLKKIDGLLLSELNLHLSSKVDINQLIKEIKLIQ